jgi:hypothetical protein
MGFLLSGAFAIPPLMRAKKLMDVYPYSDIYI